VYLTSSLTATVERCNTLAIRFTFAKPVRSVHLTYATKGGAFQMLITDSHGNVTPVAPAASPTPVPGTLTNLSFDQDAAPGTPITAIQFGHASTDPNVNEFTVIRRVTFTFA